MVRAWIMDSSQTEQRELHMTDPPQFVDVESLKEKCGVLYYKVDADNYETCGVLNRLKKEHGYTYEDLVDIRPHTLPDYEKKLKIFYEEHMHADEEIRLILEGSGYFDVRNEDDQWVRVEVVKGDMLVLPPGIYHRFTLDTKDYIKAKRFFVGEPVWTPHNRPCEEHPSRAQYAQKYVPAQACQQAKC